MGKFPVFRAKMAATRYVGPSHASALANIFGNKKRPLLARQRNVIIHGRLTLEMFNRRLAARIAPQIKFNLRYLKKPYK